MAKSSVAWETGKYEKARTDRRGLAGAKGRNGSASHRFGKCSECREVICVEKVVTDGPSTQGQTTEMLNEAFRTHVKLKHSEDFNLAAVPATERHDA